MYRKILLGTLVGTTLGCASQASAVTLPASSIITSITATSSSGTAAKHESDTTFIDSSATSSGSSAAVVASVQPLPNINATASVDGGGQATVFAQMQYYFQVTGPVGVQVPIFITASGHVSAAVTQNSAQLYLSAPLGTELLASACQVGVGGNCGALSNQASFSIDLSKSITSNTLYIIGMTLSIVAHNMQAGGTDAAAGFIDPMITIDPLFDLANQFTLEFSTGVGNSPRAAPLPAALPLFATVLVGGGLIAWRRKRKAKQLSV